MEIEVQSESNYTCNNISQNKLIERQVSNLYYKAYKTQNIIHRLVEMDASSGYLIQRKL